MSMTFKVIVPCRKKLVSYPPKGHNLYTRQEAIDVLKRFYSRAPWKEGDQRECWAESETERFTLHFPNNLLEK